MKIAGVLLLGVGILTSSSLAAEISCDQVWGEASTAPYLERSFPSGRRPEARTCRAALIKGEIASGDSEKFVRLLESNHPFLESVHLWSSGGSVAEAIKIGRLVRKVMLTTGTPWVEENWGDYCEPGPTCHCASACALIWAAGIVRSGNKLGLHRPSIRSTEFANLPPDRASSMYRLLLKEARRLTPTQTPTAAYVSKWCA
jgi:hypothetical protein